MSQGKDPDSTNPLSMIMAVSIPAFGARIIGREIVPRETESSMLLHVQLGSLGSHS